MSTVDSKIDDFSNFHKAKPHREKLH